MPRAWRLIKRKFADHAFDGEGSRLYASRWTSPGHPVAFALTLPGICRVRYHDTLAVFGHFLELWESTETMRGLLEMIEDAAREWDGRDPIRPTSVQPDGSGASSTPAATGLSPPPALYERLLLLLLPVIAIAVGL